MFDSHLHSKFSGDSDAEPPLIISRAKEYGLSGITFTDHLDLDYLVEPDLFNLDLSAYTSCIGELKKSASDDLQILLGIELGMQRHLGDAYSKILSDYDFDFCIGSVHSIQGLDPYFDEFFEGHSVEEKYHDYFEYVLENIRLFDKFDSLGHLDYVIRYGNDYCLRNGMALVELDETELITEILKTLISKDKSLEVNTGAFLNGLNEPNPSYDILALYKSLGGKMITIGSDAHRPDQLGTKFSEVAEVLKSIGFKKQMVYKKRIPEEYPI